VTAVAWGLESGMPLKGPRGFDLLPTGRFVLSRGGVEGGLYRMVLRLSRRASLVFLGRVACELALPSILSHANPLVYAFFEVGERSGNAGNAVGSVPQAGTGVRADCARRQEGAVEFVR
jgi:hypothetical protein